MDKCIKGWFMFYIFALILGVFCTTVGLLKYFIDGYNFGIITTIVGGILIYQSIDGIKLCLIAKSLQNNNK